MDCPAFFGFCTNPSSECRQETLLEILPWGCSSRMDVAGGSVEGEASRVDVAGGSVEREASRANDIIDVGVQEDRFKKIHESKVGEMPAIFIDALTRIPERIRDQTEENCLEVCRTRSDCKAFRFDRKNEETGMASRCLLFQTNDDALDCTRSNCLANVEFDPSWTAFHSVAYIRNSLVNA